MIVMRIHFILAAVLGLGGCVSKPKTVYRDSNPEIGLVEVHEFPNGARIRVLSAVRWNGNVVITADLFTVGRRSLDFDKDSLKVIIDGREYLPFEVLGENTINPNRTERLLVSLAVKQYPELRTRTLDRSNVSFQMDFLPRPKAAARPERNPSTRF